MARNRASVPSIEEAVVKSPSFNPPAEADWHRMISEAAYYRAEKRGFAEGHVLEDWLKAEEQVKAIISSSH
jgi:hypothetical protein